MDSLRMTRDYRALTYGFRATSRCISKFTFDPLESLCVKLGLIKTHQRTLLWTKSHKPESESRTRPSGSSPSHAASPSIELTLYPHDPHDESAVHDTPAMAHSLFPPARTNRRARNKNDVSYIEVSLPMYQRARTSEDSGRPPVQHPSDVRRSRASSSTTRGGHMDEQRRRSSEIPESRSSGEHLLAPESLASEQTAFTGWTRLDPTVYSRQGYQRANSDPSSQPIEIVAEVEQSGLGTFVSTQQHDA